MWSIIYNFSLTHSKSYMVFKFTSWHLTLGGIERSNQGHLVFIGLYIILSVLLDSGAVRPRGLLFLRISTHFLGNTCSCPSNLIEYNGQLVPLLNSCLYIAPAWWNWLPYHHRSTPSTSTCNRLALLEKWSTIANICAYLPTLFLLPCYPKHRYFFLRPNQLPKTGFGLITLKVIFQGRKGLNLPRFANFDIYFHLFKICSVTFFSLCWHEASQDGDNELLREGFVWITLKVNVKVRKVWFDSFSHISLY